MWYRKHGHWKGWLLAETSYIYIQSFPGYFIPFKVFFSSFMKFKREFNSCFLFNLEKVEGGSSLHVKVRWSQKMVYQDGQFCLSIPFSFPTYVIPVASNMIKREKIQLNLKACIGTQVLCKTNSHPLKVSECIVIWLSINLWNLSLWTG